MSGLKSQFGTLYAGAFAIVNTAGPGEAPNLVPEFLFRFMARLAIEAAPYDQAKTLDAKFITSNKNVIGALTTVTFYQGVSYPQSEHFLIVALRLLTNTNASLTAGVWLPGSADGTFLAGSFDVINSKSAEMVAVPFNAFPQSANVADQDAGFLAHEQGILWQGQTTLTAPSTWPAAVTTNYNADLQFWGAKLI